MRKVRCSEPSKENTLGRGMVFLPASPQVPEAGVVKAAVLKSCPAASMGRPVASARTVLETAVPLTCERLPPTVAVRGLLECRLTPLLTVQSLKMAPFQPLIKVPPPIPMPELYCNCKVRLWRWSKLERPRSAERSSQFCATGVLPWPRPPVPASSIDLENWYDARHMNPLWKRRVNWNWAV